MPGKMLRCRGKSIRIGKVRRMAKVKVYASVEDRLQDAEREMQEFARKQAVEKLQQAIDLLEEKAEGGPVGTEPTPTNVAESHPPR